MKSKTYNILGGSLLTIGILWTLTLLFNWGFYRFFDSFIKPFRGGGDFWELAFVIVPILFIVVGIYYLDTGLRKKELNRLIHNSAVFQLISLISIVIGAILTLIICMISRDGFCMLLIVPFAVVSLIASSIGLFLLIEGWIVGKKELSKRFTVWSVVIFLIIVGILALVGAMFS